ncbi:4'-phosphopantetheinyl transferase [Streptomyces sp. NPDC056503]|uniref:4'-phosphopantetheinyl transferase family protein n=1 Tax=Streptomyces sp. NPDC056503 TaxID=3345842 RepID=UPI0036AFDA90
MIGAVLPPEASWATLDHDPGPEVLFPAEAAIVANSVASRRAEFAAGRHCARLALEGLGIPPVPIPSGPRGEPRWPDGIVGSLTHCAGFRAAAVARRADVRAVGIDAEPHAPLPEGVLDAIALPEEAAHLRELRRDRPGVDWDRLLFSAKESVYKAWFPLAARMLGFDEARLVLTADGRFTARLLVPGPVVDGRALTGFAGRWAAGEHHVVTSVHVPARPGGAAPGETHASEIEARETEETHG